MQPLLPFTLLCISLPLTGCLQEDGPEGHICVTGGDEIISIDGTDLHVNDGNLILRAADATVWADCSRTREVPLSVLRVGDVINHDAQQVATSNPMQAWPDNIVLV